MNTAETDSRYSTPSESRETRVLEAERKTWSYWFADGLPNLVAGVICVLLAMMFVVLSHHRDSRSPMVFVGAAVPTFIFILVFARLRKTIEWLKARITYPRTGYAASPYFTYATETPPPADLTMLNLSSAPQGILPDASELARDAQDRRGRMWITLALYGAALLCAGFVHQRWICGALGIAAGIGIWIPTRKNERMSWAVVFSLPFTAMYLLMIAGSDGVFRIIERLGFFLVGAGLMLACTGAVALARYLKQNPVARA